MKDQEAIQRGIRIRRAEKGARATIETRVARIVAERGLTERQLAKFYVSRRKNCKPRFDYWAFAEAHGISPDWIFHGDPWNCTTAAPVAPPHRWRCSMSTERETYLGDGLYASFDGWQIRKATQTKRPPTEAAFLSDKLTVLPRMDRPIAAVKCFFPAK